MKCCRCMMEETVVLTVELHLTIHGMILNITICLIACDHLSYSLLCSLCVLLVSVQISKYLCSSIQTLLSLLNVVRAHTAALAVCAITAPK